MNKFNELTHEVVIDRAPPLVWKVLANLEDVQHYNPAVQSATYVPGPKEGVGAMRQCRVKEGLLTEKIIAWHSERFIEMELVKSPWPIRQMHWRTTLEPHAKGTRVTQILRYSPKFGVFGAVLNALIMRKQLTKNLDIVFSKMKDFIETRY